MVSYNASEDQMAEPNRNSDHYLHSVQKSSASKVYKKTPAASLAPATGPRSQQPKVYKVKPIHFRELVQQLTGAPAERHPPAPAAHGQSQAQLARRSSLQSVAPPPLPLHHRHHSHQFGGQNETTQMSTQAVPAEPADQKPMFGGSFGGSTELTLSPNFQAWFSFAMLSPGAAAVSQM